MTTPKVFRRATCTVCGGEIAQVQLQYEGRSVGRGWIHQGLENALGAQTKKPHEAKPGKPGEGKSHTMATRTAQKAASKTAAKPATSGTKTGRTVGAASSTASASSSKSDQMRALFKKGQSVAEVAKATGSHYSFAHGVMRRMVAAGELKANATTPREAKAAKPAAKKASTAKAAPATATRQTAAQRQAAKKQAGRPTAARRAANRKATPTEE